jgi:hypothetical protein
MRKATVLSAAFLIACSLAACKRKEGEDVRCRVFDKPPPAASPEALAEYKAAYEDVSRIAECAKAAAMTVDEYMTEHRVRERLSAAGRALEVEGRSLLEGANQTIRDVKQGAEQALEAAQRKAEEELKAIQDMAQ